MLDTSQWPQIELDVLKGIHLDPRNVRLEVADAKVEADIIEDLFANEDALGLVEGICKIGYLTHETPVVLKRAGKLVMVEGNRRLAALKAIQNPMLVPDYQARIATLADLLPDRAALSVIRVMVAPNQTEADQLIAAIHTGNLRKAWNPSRQAAFFQAQIDSGRTLNELLTRYPTINVTKFVYRAHIINFFKSVKYDEAELQDFLTTRKWARGLSTLNRIHESKEFLGITGLAVQADGQVTKAISDPVFKDIATVIVRGMHEGNLNTRTLNSTTGPQFTQLMAELRRIVADAGETALVTGAGPAGTLAGAGLGKTPPKGTSPTGTSSSGAGTPTTAIPRTPSGKTSTKPPPAARKKKPKFLDMDRVTAPETYPEALKLLVGELSAIDVQRFPNATFLMVRAVLEKSIKAFAEAHKVDIRATGNNQSGRVQLGEALNWLLEHIKVNGPRPLVQVVDSVRTGRLVTYTSSSDALNAVNHNHHFMVDPDEAFALWSKIEPIIRFAMKP